MEEIIIPFNKIGLRRWAIFYGVIAMFTGLMLLVSGISLLDSIQSQTWGMVLLSLFGLIFMSLLAVYMYQEWHCLVSQLRKDSPALVITEAGIEDYASAYRVGPLAWDEIERMYPSVLEHVIFTRRLFKRFPHRRTRIICIRLKSKDPFLNRIPPLRSWPARIDSLTGRGRWVAIPEWLLSSPADEVMLRLNQFYITRVRKHGPAQA